MPAASLTDALDASDRCAPGACGVGQKPIHVLRLMHAHPDVGTTEPEDERRALDQAILIPLFVRDGDLNRVDIAALSPDSLVGGDELGSGESHRTPKYPRSTRRVQATSSGPPLTPFSSRCS